MRIHVSHFSAAFLLVGINLFPLISHGFFTDELRKIHEQSIEQRESQREQFKQDVLEKRKEIRAKWHDRKEEFKNKIKEKRDKIKSEFDMDHAAYDTEGMLGILGTSTMTLSSMQDQNEIATSSFLGVVRRGVKDIIHTLFPF